MDYNIIDKQLYKYRPETERLIKDCSKLHAVKFLNDKKLGFKLGEIVEYCNRIIAGIPTEYDKLKEQRDSLLAALKDARDTLVLATLIDKSNTCEKSLKIAEEAIKKCEPLT